MRLLFDQNLSRHLVGQLRDPFPESQHVVTLGLAAATDREIWEYAGENDYLLVSKDSDFRQLAFLHGPPPKVLWLRVGNTSTVAIAVLLLDHLETIDSFATTDDEALLVLPDLTDR